MQMHTRRDLLKMVGATGIAAIVGNPALAAPSRPYHACVLARAPAGHWRFEEKAGSTARVSSSGRYNGTYHGGVALGQDGAIQSEADASIGLNGTDAFVEIQDSAAFSQATSGNGLIVEAWMRPDAPTFTGQTAQRYIHCLGKGEAGAFE